MVDKNNGISTTVQFDLTLKMLTEHSNGKRLPTIFYQIFAASASILCSISIGTVVGYSAILLPQIKEEQNFNFTSNDESWIASGATLPMAPFCILGGLLMEFYGRKLSNILVSIPLTIGWIIIYFSNGFNMFLWGRFLQGISLGIAGPLNSVFIGETSDPQYRSIFLASVSLGYTFGILFTHVIGTYFLWQKTCIFCSIISCMVLIAFIFVPESPQYFLGKDKIDEAYKSFAWLRGCSTEAAEEFSSMLSHTKSATIQETNFLKTIKYIKNVSFYEPLLFLLAMFFILQIAGVNIVTFYTVYILKNTINSSYNEYLTMILIDNVRFIVSLITCVVIPKFRQKFIFIFSGIGSGICLLLFSAFIHLAKYWKILNSFPSCPVIFLIGFICFSSFGLLPLPWCLIGELFPKSSRGLGSGLASAGNFMFFFTSIKIAPNLFDLIGITESFIIFGSLAILGTIALYQNFPDTHNKTLHEIEERFKRKTTQS